MIDVVRLRPGRRLWTFRGTEPGAAPILLWHGSGGCESDVLAPLAARAASLGPTVYVPDWEFDSADRGRADLLASLDHVLTGADALTLAGWSLGGAAAAGVAVALSDVPLRAVVTLAAGLLGREPVTDTRPIDALASWPVGVPCRLVHGVDDEVVPVQESREFAAALAAAGVAVTLTEVAGRHAAVVATEYDPVARRCLPSDAADVRAAGAASVRALVGDAAAAE